MWTVIIKRKEKWIVNGVATSQWCRRCVSVHRSSCLVSLGTSRSKLNCVDFTNYHTIHSVKKLNALENRNSLLTWQWILINWTAASGDAQWNLHWRFWVSKKLHNWHSHLRDKWRNEMIWISIFIIQFVAGDKSWDSVQYIYPFEWPFLFIFKKE